MKNKFADFSIAKELIDIEVNEFNQRLELGKTNFSISFKVTCDSCNGHAFADCGLENLKKREVKAFAKYVTKEIHNRISPLITVGQLKYHVDRSNRSCIYVHIFYQAEDNKKN